jgi:plasmid stability protein
MQIVPNLHVRDVPAEALETLRAAAARHGRSLNSEIVGTLVAEADRIERRSRAVAQLRDIQRRMAKALPDGFPPGFEPETLIRHARDGR